MFFAASFGPEYATVAMPENWLPPSFGIMLICIPPLSRSAPTPLVSTTTSWICSWL